MKTAGIICEYNPLHEGHAYLFSQARAAGADLLLCVMSGDFTERGEAALLPPVTRAAMAVEAGADLVVELPFPYAASSARYFAGAGVGILAALGADTLVFGSERGELSALYDLAEKADTVGESAPADKKTATAAAHFSALGASPDSNDILAIEYLRAIRKSGAKLTPFAVKRVGMGYRDAAGEGFASATALRGLLRRGENVENYLPAAVRPRFREAAFEGLFDTAALGPAMLAFLRTAGGKVTENGGDCPFAECGGGLLKHLCRAAEKATDYASLCRLAATRHYTDGRIRRALLFALAGVTAEDLKTPPAFVRLLAADEKGLAYLAATRKTRALPVTTKQADAAALGEAAGRQRELARRADGLYALCRPGSLLPADLQTQRPFLLKKH